MQCKHCGFVLAADDHRCQRCGRRVAPGAAHAVSSGANALAVSAKPTLNTQEWLKARGIGDSLAPPAPAAAAVPEQSALFAPPADAPRKVIPFDKWQRSRVEIETSGRRVPKPARKKHTPGKTTVEQATLEFVPAQQSKSRKLKTEVDAQIYCDRPAAPRMLRCLAASIDAAMILIGFGLLAGIALGAGAGLGAGRQFWMTLGAAFGLVSLFYGMVWSIAGTETIGMRTMGLHLITFDGFPVDGRARGLRMFSTWLSFLSGGLGLLWAIADEERLTWHDHISNTFPTVREKPGSFNRQQ